MRPYYNTQPRGVEDLRFLAVYFPWLLLATPPPLHHSQGREGSTSTKLGRGEAPWAGGGASQGMLRFDRRKGARQVIYEL